MKKILFIMVALPSLIYAEISANVSLTSNYVWRGVTQTGDEVAVQGGFDYANDSGFYAGVWGSNVSFNWETDLEAGGNELDIYAGFSNDMFDVGFIDYRYPGNDSDLDFTEVYIGFTGVENLSIYYYDIASSDFDSEFEDDASGYLSIGYEFGDISMSYGDFAELGSDISLSYGFACGKFDCSVTYYDFSSDYESLEDDDGLYISIGASLMGRTIIGNNCFIGAGATIIDNIKITDNVIIGANSLVINDISYPGTYVGNPVRKIK